MKKIFVLYFLHLYTIAMAQEPTIAILESVLSNTHQKLRIAQVSFLCEAYGVITPAKLTQKQNLSSACKESLERFYLKNPYQKYFSALHLHPMQSYRVEFKEKKCLLYARGKSTLSEMLLREGLAILEPNFRDREYETLYRNAQKSARIEAKGVWDDNLRHNCLAELYE